MITDSVIRYHLSAIRCYLSVIRYPLSVIRYSLSVMSVESILGAMFSIGVPLALLAAVFGFRWHEGLWGNTVAVFCVLFSILFSIAWWETVAELLCQAVPSMLYASDLVAAWGIFLVCLAILTTLTQVLSRVKVLFLLPIEAAGNFVVLCILYILILNFFLLTVVLAPIGAKQDAQVSKDSMLIKTCRILSQGTLEAFVDPRPFDEFGELRRDHLLRRQELQKMAEGKDGTIRIFYEGDIPPRKKK